MNHTLCIGCEYHISVDSDSPSKKHKCIYKGWPGQFICNGRFSCPAKRAKVEPKRIERQDRAFQVGDTVLFRVSSGPQRYGEITLVTASLFPDNEDIYFIESEGYRYEKSIFEIYKKI